MRLSSARLATAGAAFAIGAVLSTVPAVSSAGAEPARSTASAPSADDASSTAAGRAAVPRAFCRGRRATIVGNAGDNRIVGTRHRDVIAAGRGADIIMGRGGADIICGSRGADVINGGRGRDRIFGGSGGDMLEGGPARDRLYGGTRRDLCSGERREHRYHFACESHRDPFGNVVSPPPTQAPSAAVARRARVTGTAPARPRRAAVGGYVQAPAVADCETTYGGRYIQLGTVSFQTYYTNPGYIALRPIYATYANGWQQAFAPRPWAIYYAPADGAVYSAAMGAENLPTGNPPGSLWGWEAYWWDGTQWTSYAISAYGAYNWVGYIGLVSAANAAVCT